ncbi:MAG: DUF1287 domain-containing protein [Actinomycetaceae bacterium]|nr:DUF1287 domain-containing protein [Actinomycetaceae bacterium]
MAQVSEKKKPRKVLRKIMGALVVLAVLGGLGVAYFLHTVNDGGTWRGREIPAYVSSVDKDGDGIDDQSDILQNAKAYIATNPTYQSKYYEGGYPDDEYGVCTDVVAFALRDAGYDLQALVDEDMRANPELYENQTPDPNIDFRRVRNLRPYFSRHAIELTTERSDIDEWQGGDIVIFTDHIAIVSDKRNRDGIPYLIHLNGTYQKNLEDNYLAVTPDTITGHYRVS